MPSPKQRRNSSRSGSISGAAVNGKFEFATVTRYRVSECPSRRRSSSCTHVSSVAQTEDFSVSLNQSIFVITFRLFLAIDLWLSKRLGVCACEDSSWGSIRPLVRLVELSGHAIPWFIGTMYCLLRSETVTEQEMMLNLVLALLLDLALVRITKTLFHRRRPVQNRSDMFTTYFEERYSFPSGHATRAAMCARFLAAQLVGTAPMRALVLAWAAMVGLSRLLLARHYVTDVSFGLAMGYCQYSLVERLWVSWGCLQDLLLLLLGEGQAVV
ncbi:phospholipid phosphatase 6-like [Hypomesus transpacificus]|uniref:phospholipid phosphatase 6-like n=1 Tax=Hypomesus transpacificus TaxID=137520 RepID=UPI001F087961|nr:phospholipid phosphatase 6-like [Hypomesus transpacificus]